ncbi:hypothetical protein N0V93_007788 [Gnomoniopsis smithogilvyi]|uniref:Uncharacterized protein n=1 Tax=Gnomoniopsis smithogilvyi TaxID=1191159 RepID=A0A9W9CU95_9PEZI|nr:hypothetical protein N0V93_007788 [Gnomoniopsis smithogilvyi]
MEVQSVIPAKRGPEDDVQFVSVQSVKKARGGSRESPLPQYQQTQDQSITQPQAQIQEDQAHTATSLSNTDPAIIGPQPMPSMANRDVSFPGLENYVFPPPPDSKSSRASRSSPVLSPRQPPQPMFPTQIQDTMQSPQSLRNFVQSPHLQVPWGMSSLYPQAAPTNSGAPPMRSMPLPSAQRSVGASPATDIDDQPLSISMVSRKAESQGLRHCEQAADAGVGPPSKQNEQDKPAQAPFSHADHGQVETLPYPSPQQEPQPQAQAYSHSQTRPPMPTVTQSQIQSPANSASNNHNTVTGSEMPVSQQTRPPKGPCGICEQMRQQFLSNQANALPIAHLPQISQGWHGQAPVPQGHMAHPNPGFCMVPNMLQNLQQRFQPMPLGHLPMGYGMQSVPVQVQVQMQPQRPLPAPSTNGAEASQGVAPQNQQGQQTQCQQAPGQGSQLASSQPLQYMYNQLATLPPSAMIQRPIMLHQQGLAPPPPPPSSKPSPQEAQKTQAPALPEAKKHSPNLIVDIAETCEELFPYDEVAKRHGVTRVKVVETFGAIIQLPLLRCTTDKKRHGKLATSRLREYTKAKKDAEATTAGSDAKITPAATMPPTSGALAAQNQAAQAQSNHLSATQAQDQQARQVQEMHAQVMQAQADQMDANQGQISQHQPPPQSGQVHTSQGRNTLTGAFDMTNTISPLGLPSNLTNGLSGHWQQQ